MSKIFVDQNGKAFTFNADKIEECEIIEIEGHFNSEGQHSDNQGNDYPNCGSCEGETYFENEESEILVCMECGTSQ